MATRSDRAAPVMKSPAGRRRLLPWLLLGTVLVVVIFGAVVGALRGPVALDLETPEGTIQAYAQSVLDMDHARARSLLTEELADRCTAHDFRSAWVPTSTTATLLEVRNREQTAEVVVRFRSMAGPEPFGAGGINTIETFSLVREGGQWRISEVPWPLFECGERP